MAYRSVGSRGVEPSQPPRVKICGITTVEDALEVIDLGAWALGLMLYDQSPRAIDILAAKELVAEVRAARPGMTTNWVGVFVNQNPIEVFTFSQTLKLDYVQLHGDENLEDIECFDDFAATLGGRARVIKALRTAPDFSPASLRPLRKYCPLLLVDSFAEGAYGGTGKTADWAIAKAICAEGPALLAGGITPENVGAAIAAVKPWGIDLSSGVEREPGVKDHHKLRQLFAAIAAP